MARTRGVESGRGSEHREEKTDWNENFEYLQLGLGDLSSDPFEFIREYR